MPDEAPLHPIFRDAPPDGAPLWRYMTYAKFAAMMQAGVLRFTRVDKFDDHFEGVWPRRDLESWNRISTLPAGFTEQTRRTHVAASCWINLEHESAAMWRLYAMGAEGVAIKTRFSRVRDAAVRMEEAAAGTLAGAARVRYIDHASDSIIAALSEGDALPNAFVPFMMKNISYQHESEVRALVVSPVTHEIEPDGCGVGIDLPDFVEEVVVNPLAEPWFEQLVLSTVRVHNLNSVRRSQLDRRIFWQRVEEPRRPAGDDTPEGEQ